MKTFVPMQNKSGVFAIIDTEDAARVLQHGWYVETRKYTSYAATSWRENGKVVNCRLHRFILKVKQGEIVDHKDRDGLNCTKDNLRFVTKSQNTLNTGREGNLTGIRFRRGKWYAYVTLHRKIVYEKPFIYKANAIRARNEAARKFHGEFAVMNHE